MSSWTLVAQTPAYKKLDGEFQLFIYYYTADSYTPVTMHMTSDDIKLKTGSGSVKDKFARILTTQINLTLGDRNRYLQQLMSGKPDTLFKGIIKKDGSEYFTGFITMHLSAYDIKQNNILLPITLYDGLTALKNLTDFTSFSNDVDHLSDIIYALLNGTGFGLNVYAYTDVYRDSTKPLHYIGVKVGDYLSIKPGASFYDVLDMILLQFSFRVYQEGNYWHLVQVPFINNGNPPVSGVLREYITSAGSQGASRVDMKSSFLVSELEWSPEEFDVDALARIELAVKSYGSKTAPYRYAHKEFLQWYNPLFLEGSAGWTVDAGTVHFKNGSLEIEEGGQVSQISGQLDANEVIQISYKILCVRMVLALADRLNHSSTYDNPLFEVQFIGDDSNTYYLHRDFLTWQTYPEVWNKFGIDVYGYDVYDYDAAAFVFAEEYSVPILESEGLEITCPNTSGKIKIILYGGATPTQSLTDYPYQLSSQFSNFNVFRKKTDNNPTEAQSSQMIYSAYASAAKQQIVKTLSPAFHDKDPFTNLHIWSFYDDPYDLPNRFISCNGNWSPAGKSLLRYLAERWLQYYVECNKGLDITFLRGKDISLTKIFSSDIYGTGTRYYLPCYKEIDLLADRKKFIILLHESKSYSLTLEQRYEV